MKRFFKGLIRIWFNFGGSIFTVAMIMIIYEKLYGNTVVEFGITPLLVSAVLAMVYSLTLDKQVE